MASQWTLVCVTCIKLVLVRKRVSLVLKLHPLGNKAQGKNESTIYGGITSICR
jgi:hypothetical protein